MEIIKPKRTGKLPKNPYWENNWNFEDLSPYKPGLKYEEIEELKRL